MHDVMRFVDEKYHANVNEAYLDAHFQPICRVVAAGMNAGELRLPGERFTDRVHPRLLVIPEVFSSALETKRNK
mgnify:CR=1 FL=1